MFLRRVVCAFLFACSCLASAAARGQIPELRYLYPAGGTRGHAVEVELIGKQLDDLTSLHFSCAADGKSKITTKLLGKNRAELTIAPDAPLARGRAGRRLAALAQLLAHWRSVHAS